MVKTTLVRFFTRGIDLEGFAHHRGSSFGRTVEAQFAQATFENYLAVDMLKKSPIIRAGYSKTKAVLLVLMVLPESLRIQMATAHLVVWWMIHLSGVWQDSKKNILIV